LSLAIGKKGQNVRLAAKLTGWKIDIKSEEEKRREVEAQFGALEIGEPAAETEATDQETVEATDPETVETTDSGTLEATDSETPEVTASETLEASASTAPEVEPAADAAESEASTDATPGEPGTSGPSEGR